MFSYHARYMSQPSSFFKNDAGPSFRGSRTDITPGSGATPTPSPLTERFLAAFPTRKIAWRTSQLREAGFGDRHVKLLVATGVLLRMRQGAYLRASYWAGLSTAGRERTVIFMHSYGTNSTSAAGFVYSHSSAARIHGLHLWQADTLIHLTQSNKPSSVGSDDQTCIHTVTLPSSDITMVGQTHVTTLERTVVDCCLTMPYKRALILTDHALRMGASLDILQDAADQLSRHRGVRNLRRVLAHADALSESPGETLTRDLLRELNIETPTLQHWIHTRAGNYRADFAWVEKRVVLEFDGKGKYFDYRPTDEAVFLERKRESALLEAGWVVIRIQWKDLFNEAYFKAKVLAALNR